MSDASGPEAHERRQRLLGVKLSALVSDHLGVEIAQEAEGFGAGAGVVVDGSAWVLIDGPADRRLGAALAWAVRHDARSLDVIADEGGATLARRAQGFDHPISIWFAEGRLLLPVVADTVAASEAAAEHLALVAMIEQAGAAPHVEHGVVTGEVRGLEMCRVVDEATTGMFVEMGDVAHDEPAESVIVRSSDGVVLEVGVGANDREAFQLLHGDIPTGDALKRVVGAVSQHRTVTAVAHPLNRMAPERFLRWQVEQEPERLGLRSLVASEPPVVRRSMKFAEPCVATGVDPDGQPVVVVFSTGVDLDLIPFVADVIVGLNDVAGRESRIVVAVPERDLVAITRDLAALLRRPVELVGLPMT